eukprot:g46701.t1
MTVPYCCIIVALDFLLAGWRVSEGLVLPLFGKTYRTAGNGEATSRAPPGIRQKSSQLELLTKQQLAAVVLNSTLWLLLVTKINLEAQRVEQNLRDELANSVSQAVSNADRSRITELEKSESELKVEVSKLRDIADVAKMQVSALEALQQSREKEVEALRKQVLDYQAQSDERALIATLHQHIIALQVSEATAVSKLQAFASKLQKMEACNLRLMQKLDEKDQTLFHTRLEGRNKAKHLRQTIQSLRRQFSGALPLAQQEKFSKTMMQLQDDKLKIMQDVKRSQEERRVAEDKALELQLKLKGLEELIGSLKDAKGAQK